MAKQVLRNVPIYSGARFTWNGDKGTTFISDLVEKRWEVFSGLYDDADDIGFWIRSHRTGVKKLFTLVESPKDNEGETISWVLKCDDLVVVVYND